MRLGRLSSCASKRILVYRVLQLRLFWELLGLGRGISAGLSEKSGYDMTSDASAEVAHSE